MQRFGPRQETQVARRSSRASLVWQGIRKACPMHIQLEAGPKGWLPLGQKEAGMVDIVHLSRVHRHPGYRIEVEIGVGKLQYVSIFDLLFGLCHTFSVGTGSAWSRSESLRTGCVAEWLFLIPRRDWGAQIEH